jgi:hypothetical protein
MSQERRRFQRVSVNLTGRYRVSVCRQRRQPIEIQHK